MPRFAMVWLASRAPCRRPEPVTSTTAATACHAPKEPLTSGAASAVTSAHGRSPPAWAGSSKGTFAPASNKSFVGHGGHGQSQPA